MTATVDFRPIVIAPTFNNAGTLRVVVEKIFAVNVPVIVVNDGATDSTPQVLHELVAASVNHEFIVLHHKLNQGKAAALLTGFAKAIELGFTHAVTIDTDGQLFPDEIPEMLRLAKESPDAIVVGVRDDCAEDYPRASRLGRNCANLLLRLEAGVRLADSQCGFRVYPLRLMKYLKCSANRYGFETEILARAGWAGIEIMERPVRCVYALPDGRVTHFQPWRDSLRAAGMHVRLVGRSIWPWPMERWNKLAKTGLLWQRIFKRGSPLLKGASTIHRVPKSTGKGDLSFVTEMETTETVLRPRN